MQMDRKLTLTGVGAGAIYGLVVRGLAYHSSSKWVGPLISVMSVAFLIVLPFSIGYIAIAVPARHERVGILRQIFEPWLAVLAAVAMCALLLWEGAICIVMLMPIALVCSSLGGLAAGNIITPNRPRSAMLSVVLVGALPFATIPIEENIPTQPDIRSVESTIDIHSGAATVWNNIERVPAIAPQELPAAWNRVIGFPRPIEATLDREGIGGVRHATFAGGVLFIETVDIWEPFRRLGFSIHADTQSIPPTTLDEHVTVGGPYFDVLHGEYIVEQPSADMIRLRLVSRHRVSTDFNWYSRLWTDAVMRNVQKSILYVIKNRCERGGALRGKSISSVRVVP
jgi:hypothetical protein